MGREELPWFWKGAEREKKEAYAGTGKQAKKDHKIWKQQECGGCLNIKFSVYLLLFSLSYLARLNSRDLGEKWSSTSVLTTEWKLVIHQPHQASVFKGLLAHMTHTFCHETMRNEKRSPGETTGDAAGWSLPDSWSSLIGWRTLRI